MSQKEGERGSVDWQAGPITLTGMGSQLRMLQHATNLNSCGDEGKKYSTSIAPLQVIGHMGMVWVSP